jgi:hypothetical protein
MLGLSYHKSERWHLPLLLGFLQFSLPSPRVRRLALIPGRIDMLLSRTRPLTITLKTKMPQGWRRIILRLLTVKKAALPKRLAAAADLHLCILMKTLLALVEKTGLRMEIKGTQIYFHTGTSFAGAPMRTESNFLFMAEGSPTMSSRQSSRVGVNQYTESRLN